MGQEFSWSLEMTVHLMNSRSTESWLHDARLRYLQGSGQVRWTCTGRNKTLSPSTSLLVTGKIDGVKMASLDGYVHVYVLLVYIFIPAHWAILISSSTELDCHFCVGYSLSIVCTLVAFAVAWFVSCVLP